MEISIYPYVEVTDGYAVFDTAGDYKITYKVNEIIEKFTYKNNKDNAAAACPEALKWIVGLVGLDPSYLRFTGTVNLTKFVDNELVEEITAPAIWEMMYFGKDQDV